ncbi:hypothetical protein GH714_011419 [Hevea brasiliensis]|uniref:Uncharacterized protein n=1 Tax=Hevea brasiliensis TaxID=3981 RepID=A0A6A6M9I8_HEVBR|nr:hypothetical protein GH714_011419 [Hevea brasiliensis]
MDEEVVNRDRNSATVEREATRNQGSGDPMSLLGSDHPDWWKSRNKNQPRQYKSTAAQVDRADQLFTNMNAVDTPLEACEDNHSIEDLSVRLGSIQQELQRLIKGKASVAANVMGPVNQNYSGNTTLHSITSFAGNFSLINACCDLQTEKVIAVAHEVAGLYKLDKSVFWLLV